MKSVVISIFAITVFSTPAIATNNHHKSSNKPPSNQSQGQLQDQRQLQVQGQAQASFNRNMNIATGGDNNAINSGGDASSVVTVGPMSFNFTVSPPAAPAQPSQPVPSQPSQPVPSQPSTPANGGGNGTLNGKVTIRQAPGVGLQLGSPTSNCLNVIGVGGSSINGGGLVSFGMNVDWCKKLEMARQAHNHDMLTLAEDLICDIEEIKALNSEDCANARERAEKATREKAMKEPAPANPVFNSN